MFSIFQEKTYHLFSWRTRMSIAARYKNILAAQALAKRGKTKKEVVTGGGAEMPHRGKRIAERLCAPCYAVRPKYPRQKKTQRYAEDGVFCKNQCACETQAKWIRFSFGGECGGRSRSTANISLVVQLLRESWHSELRHQGFTMSRTGANTKSILAYLRKKTGTTLKDVHNMIQEVCNSFEAGRTDVERAVAVFDEFMEGPAGNTAEFIVDSESNKVREVTFWSARQKLLFAAFPEVVLVDATHDTNVNRYMLFRFAVHNVFGRG
ncbi:hypothetical protein PHMEG_00018271 [Phytophthora megakarya]|uniref:ZSWIM1/3 RNaseH-like domain-containing protein n=1 Tax=Phytophthora megakarya TaxID=4795 RepID=A0A225VUH9_9STRA|nr:hypothetical protein PHMEG_00018271 [Phytophthora megakarya]